MNWQRLSKQPEPPQIGHAGLDVPQRDPPVCTPGHEAVRNKLGAIIPLCQNSCRVARVDTEKPRGSEVIDEVFRRTQRRGVEEDGAAAQPSDCRIGGVRGHLGRHAVSLADAGLGPGRLLLDAAHGAGTWTERDKFAVVVKTTTLSEADRAEYCRKRGLYLDQAQADKPRLKVIPPHVGVFQQPSRGM